MFIKLRDVDTKTTFYVNEQCISHIEVTDDGDGWVTIKGRDEALSVNEDDTEAVVEHLRSNNRLVAR